MPNESRAAATPWSVDGMIVRDRYGRQVGGAEPIAPPATPADTAPASSDEMDARGCVHANLMAAAPEMYEALRDIQNHIKAPPAQRDAEWHAEGRRIDERARAALAKADGK